MKIKYAILLFFLGIAAFFFYKTSFLDKIPFPGDLLIAEYSPWKQYSILGYNPGSFPNKAQYFDVIRQIYPWKTFTIELLKNGQFPLWNPYNFSGSPLFANSQSAVLYPLNIFYFLLPQAAAWSVLVALQPFLAGLFTYFYARKIKISKQGSILSAVAYSYCLFMSVFLEYNTIGHVVLWLPLILFSIEKIIEKVNWKFVLLLIVSLSAAFMAGHIQIFGFIYLFAFVYAVARLIDKRVTKQKIITVLASFILPIGIVGIALLPLLELISNSARTSQEYSFLITRLLLQPYQFVLLLAPDIFGNPATRNYAIGFDQYPGNAVYVGVIPLLLSFFSLRYFRKNFFVTFFAVVSFIFLLLFVRTPFTELFYKIPIPFFSTGSPTNAIFLLSFSLSILAGIGIDYWLIKKVLFKKVLFSFAFLFVALWGFFVLTHPSIVLTKNFILPTLLFVLCLVSLIVSQKKEQFKQIAFFVILFLSVFDSWYYFQKFNPFVNTELVFPETKVISFLSKTTGINRVWGYGSSSVEPNFQTQFHLFSPDGYDPLYTKDYGIFIQSSKDGKLVADFTNQTRSDAVVTPGFGELDLPTNIYRAKILQLLGVKYIVASKGDGTTEKTFPAADYKELYSDKSFFVFENLKSLPRFYLADNFTVYNNNDDFAKTFFLESFDSGKTILLDEQIPGFNNSTQQGTASLISYFPNEVSIKTNTPSDKILFLSDTYYPGWEAMVDGKPTKIYKAFYAFRAVSVPPGTHIVNFIYKPASFNIGKIITIISVVGTLCFLFLIGKYKYDKS